MDKMGGRKWVFIRQLHRTVTNIITSIAQLKILSEERVSIIIDLFT